MGLRIKISGADFSALGVNANVYNYLEKSGINDPGIKSALMLFVKNLISAGIWDKIDYLYPILGSSADQIKYNLKNPVAEDVLVGNDGAVITNTIDKGIVLTGVLDVPGPVVKFPFTGAYVASVDAEGGHAMYFLNQAFAPTNLGLPISYVFATDTSNVSDNTFALSPRYGASISKYAVVNGRSYSHNPSYTLPGAYSVLFNGATVDVYANKAFLVNMPYIGYAEPITPTNRVTLGTKSVYPTNNTISFMSFGKHIMTGPEMITYQTLVTDLIALVHGIVV